MIYNISVNYYISVIYMKFLYFYKGIIMELIIDLINLKIPT